MTKDDIIRMAQEASPYPFDEGLICFEHAELITFCNLVAANEREACAKLVDDIEARCVAKDVNDPPLNHVAAAIRERGQA